MPISYETPQPFSSAISSAYGAAQQFSQDAPAIISATMQGAQLRNQQQGQRDALTLAALQANAESQDRRASLYQRSNEANADREQQALNLGATLTQRNQEATFDANVRMLQQARGAELQNWLGQQEMTQKEAMRLQQMKAAVADVQSSNLPPEMKEAAIMRLRTGIDPLEERAKMTQAKMMEEHANLYKAQVAQKQYEVQQMAKVMNMTAAERVHYEVDPQVKQQIENDVARLPIPQEAKALEVRRRIAAHPGAQQFVIAPDGKLEAVKRERPEPVKPFFMAVPDYNKVAQAEADRAHPPEGGEEAARTPANKAYAQKVADRMEDEYYAAHGMESPRRVAERRAAEEAAKNRVPRGDSATEIITGLQNRADLPNEVKGPLIADLAAAATMLKRAGGFENLTESERQLVLRAGKAFDQLPPPPPPPEPSPAPKSGLSDIAGIVAPGGALGNAAIRGGAAASASIYRRLSPLRDEVRRKMRLPF